MVPEAEYKCLLATAGAYYINNIYTFTIVSSHHQSSIALSLLLNLYMLYKTLNPNETRS